MPIPISDKFKPMGVSGFALMDAEDIEMPNGERLHEVIPVIIPVSESGYLELEAKGEIDPNAYYMVAGD